MSTLVITVLIVLMLTVATVFISFCIYSQERSNHRWLVERINTTQDCGERCQLEKCKLFNANGQFAFGLHSLAKADHYSDSSAELLQCTADSYFGLNDFDAALEHYLRAHNLMPEPSAWVLARLSLIYTDVLHQPDKTVALLEPFLTTHDATTVVDVVVSEAPANLRANTELSCVYLQALVQDPEQSPQVLLYLETLRSDKVPFDACILYVQHRVLTTRRYYADAYQYGVEFVRNYPALHQAHTAMGEALLALQRTAEATVVLKVAHSLVDAQELRTSLPSSPMNRNATLDSLIRLGNALYACDAHKEAESVLALAVSLLQSAEFAQQCTALSRVGQLYLNAADHNKAYVALLQCVKHCPTFAEGYLHLGIAQRQMGLLHDALSSLKVAARSKSHKAEAKAQQKLVKAADTANLERQAKLDEEKLGPQAPLDPNIKRQEPKGLYIDFLAKMEKEKEDRENGLQKERSGGEAQTSADVDGEAKSAVESGSNEPVASPALASPTSSDLPLDPQVNPSGQEIASEAVPEALSGVEADTRRRANAQIEQALAYLNRDEPNYAQALTALRGAIKKAPRYAEPYMLRGDLNMQRGELFQASEDYLKVFAELDLHNATCAMKLHTIAVKLISLDQVEKANAIYAQLGEWAPNDERSCTDLASAYLKQKEYNGALIAMFRIDPTVPTTTERVKFIALIHELSGSQVRASETLYVGIYKNLTTYVDLGEMYFRSGNKSMGIKAFEAAIAAKTAPAAPLDDPKETGTLHVQVAKAHLALYDEALASAQEDARDALEDQGLSGDESVPGAEALTLEVEVEVEVDPVHLHKAYVHFAGATKLGISNYDTRKFFARFPQFAPSEVSIEKSAVTEGDDDDKPLHLRRWMSRRSSLTDFTHPDNLSLEPEEASEKAPAPSTTTAKEF